MEGPSSPKGASELGGPEAEADTSQDTSPRKYIGKNVYDFTCGEFIACGSLIAGKRSQLCPKLKKKMEKD